MDGGEGLAPGGDLFGGRGLLDGQQKILVGLRSCSHDGDKMDAVEGDNVKPAKDVKAASGSRVNGDAPAGVSHAKSPLTPLPRQSGSSKGPYPSRGGKEHAKGFSRIAPLRKIVNAFVKRSRLEISSLHISQPDSSGLCAKGKIRLTHLGTGPVPLVGLKVRFKDATGAALHWTPAYSATAKRQDAAQLTVDRTVVQVYIEPITLQPSTPGSVSSEVDMRFVLQDDTRAAFIQFVRHIIRSDAKQGTRILMKAVGVEVKAFGLKFGGLQLEKDVVLGGLGCLGGALVFDDGLLAKIDRPIRPESQTPDRATGKEMGRRKRFTLGSLKASKSNLKKTAAAAGPVKVEQAGKRAGQTRAKDPSAGMLRIKGLDIVGGDAVRGIEVRATVTIENPAREPELIIEPGELRFALCIDEGVEAAKGDDRGDVRGTGLPPGMIRVGIISLSPTTLRPGMNDISAVGYLTLPAAPTDGASNRSAAARAHAAGSQLLRSIMQNEGVYLCAVAPEFDEQDPINAVSSVGWLAAAFTGARINTYIPPLGERVQLLDGAEVRVEGHDTDGGAYVHTSSSENLIGSVARATLRNGFGADIHVHDLHVSARSEALIGDDGSTEILELGKLFSPKMFQSHELILRNGHPEHVSLPMEINPDPRVLIEILRKSARSRNVDLGNPLTELLEELRFAHWTEAGFAEPPKSRPASSMGTSRRNSTNATRTSLGAESHPSDDLAALLANALANMHVTALVEAEASIGDYKLPGKLVFEQRNLPIALSTATAAALLPLVGKPFVKAMVDRAEIEVETINVVQMDDRGILARLTLQLLNFGPLSAEAEFDEGLLLRDQHGKSLAVIHFENSVSVTAGSEEPVVATARIVPAPGPKATEVFSEFVGQLLRSDKLTLNALADPISITSGGVHFRASLEKEITVAGLGGFKGLSMNDLQIVGEASAPAAGVSFSVAAPANASQNSAISFTTTAQLENQGDIYLKISKLEVAIAVDDVQIGQASIDDLDLAPRRKANLRVRGILYAPPPSSRSPTGGTLSASGSTDESSPHATSIAKMSQLISTLLAGDQAAVQVLGRRAWVSDPSKPGSRPVSLAWLDDALRTFNTSATIQWKGGVQIVSGIDVGKVEATFAARKGLQLRIEEVMAQYSVPFPIQFELLSIDATMDIMFAGKTIAKCHAVQDTIEHVERAEPRPSNPVHAALRQRSSSRLPPPSSPVSSVAGGRRRSSGTASSMSHGGANAMERYPSTTSSSGDAGMYKAGLAPPESAQAVVQTGKVRLSLKAFQLETQEEDLLGDMITHIVEAGPEGTEKITLHGLAHATVKTAVGVLSITVPLGVEHKMDISGLDGLRSSPLRYTDIKIVSANSKYIRLTLNIQSHNPSDALTVIIPDSSLSLSAYFQDSFVGDVIVGADQKGITLLPGAVTLNGVEFRYRPTTSSEAAVRPVLSQLFAGESVQLTIKGHRKSSVNSALAQALRTISVPIEIAPLGRNDILERIKVQLGIGVVTSNSIDAKYVLNNPIDLPIEVLHLYVKAYYRSQPFGTASKSYSKEGMLSGKILGRTGGGGGGDISTEASSANASTPDVNKAPRKSEDGTALRRMLLEPGVRRFQNDLVVKLQQPPDQLIKAFLAERGNIVLDVDVVIKMEVQGYVIPHFAYRQKVPLEVSGLQGVAGLLRLV